MQRLIPSGGRSTTRESAIMPSHLSSTGRLQIRVAANLQRVANTGSGDHTVATDRMESTVHIVYRLETRVSWIGIRDTSRPLVFAPPLDAYDPIRDVSIFKGIGTVPAHKTQPRAVRGRTQLVLRQCAEQRSSAGTGDIHPALNPVRN